MSLNDAAAFLDRLHRFGIDPQEWLLYVAYSGHASGDAGIKPTNLADEFDIHAAAAELLLELAGGLGLVTFPNAARAKAVPNIDAIIGFLYFSNRFDTWVTERQRRLLAEEGVHEASFHAAVPVDFEEEVDTDLMATLGRLLDSANDDIFFVTPFINRFGTEMLVKRIARATDRGVVVTLLTRDTETDNADEVASIARTVRKAGVLSNFHIYDYGTSEGNLHAKAIVVDGAEAYIGSANMTSYSLTEAIEIGIVIDGPVVERLEDFLVTVGDSTGARQVSLESIVRA